MLYGTPAIRRSRYKLLTVNFKKMMIDNKNEEFLIVDEMGNILGAVTRGHAHDGSKILHPVVHLHVFNSRGDLYLQHRPAWKDIQPDKWDTACGGHVDLGERITVSTSNPNFLALVSLIPVVAAVISNTLITELP